jgi:hypothetical protein
MSPAGTPASCIQDAYLAAVEAAHDAAVLKLQETCIQLHSSTQSMDALLLAHDMAKWGGALAQAASGALTSGWTQAQLAGAVWSALLQCILTCKSDSSLRQPVLRKGVRLMAALG